MADLKPKSVKHSSDQNKAANKQDVDAKGFHHFRYIIIIFGGLMTGSMVFLRLSISVPMLSMVNKTAIYLKEHPNSTIDDLRDFFPPDYVETGEFLWTNEIQQVIMTGYMVAYGLPQFFTTKLAMKYGVRKSVPLSLALCGISSLLTPVMSYWGWQWCLVLRLINAVGGSALWPVMVNVIELWMPKHEAAKGLALIQFVSNFGYISAPLLGGYLTHLINWKAAFYIPGIVTLILCLLWYIISADEPASSRFLSQKELNYINGTNSDDPKKIDDDEGPKTELPWYFMFKIKSFYPLCIVWFLYCCSLHGFLFLMPSYLNRLLQIPIEEVGALNSTIQIGLLFCMLWPAPAASFLQEKFNLSLTAARNILVTTVLTLVAGTYCYLAIYHDHLILVISLNRFFHMANDTILISTVMSQFAGSGTSGLIYSMINTQGQLSVVLACWAIGRFLDYTGETLECWSYVMFFMTFLVALHLLVYVFFCHSRPVEVEGAPKKEVEQGSV